MTTQILNNKMPETTETSSWLMQYVTWIISILGSVGTFLFFGYKYKMAELKAKTEAEIRSEEAALRKEKEYIISIVNEATKGAVDSVLSSTLEDIRLDIQLVNKKLDINSKEHKENIKAVNSRIDDVILNIKK